MKSKMKAKFNLIVFLTTLAFLGCNEVTTFKDYKFADKSAEINCKDETLNKLVNEALFSFEDDITKFYIKKEERNPLARAYSRFISGSIYGNAKFEEIASPHTVKVFNALKNYDLWDAQNPSSYLNYNSPFFSCIAKNIQDKNLKTTLNALISTNSMSPKLFGSPLRSKYNNVIKDKYLAAYVAFDLYYAKLFSVDLSQVKEKPPVKEKVDFNKIPPAETTPAPSSGLKE